MAAEEFDAVVIGSGVNGLVATAELALAGWSVALVERDDRLGGFIASGEQTLPGYIHDIYSSWHPLFTSGGAYGALKDELHARGLEYRNTEGAVTGSIAPGRAAVAYADPQKTADALDDPDDRAAYLAMIDEMGARAETVFGALGSELNRTGLLKLGWKALRTLKPSGVASLAHDAVMSGRAFTRSRFNGSDVDQLWTPWLLHAGLNPDSVTGGMMVPVLAMTMHQFGIPTVAGGANNFVNAFQRLFAELDVTVMTGRQAESVTVSAGVANGVVTDAGLVRARRAVIASVTPQALYGTLLKSAAVPQGLRDKAEKFRFGRAAMQIHVALDRPLVWADERVQDAPLVHLSTGSSSTGVACAQADGGMLPASPTVVVGRQHLLDPTRVPPGKGSLWLQLQELPWRPEVDSAGMISVDGTWSKSTTDAYVERVLNKVEESAPGTISSILDVNTLNPADLANANPNAVNGDVYSGSMELDQNLLWRPLAGANTHATKVSRLWHIGASTHPGAGLGGGAGHLVAQTLINSEPRKQFPAPATGK